MPLCDGTTASVSNPAPSNAFSYSFVNDTTVKINNVHTNMSGSFSNLYLAGQL